MPRPSNNVSYFVFDEPAPLRSVIVSDDDAEAAPLKAALSAAADPARKYLCTVLPLSRLAEIPWDEAALIVWQAPLPKADSGPAKRMQDFVAAGRTLLFLPPETPDDTALFGLQWDKWETEKAQPVEWWRNDADLLANTRDGAALPLGTMEVARRCGISGEGVPLARMAGRATLLMRSAQAQGGSVYFLGTLTGAGNFEPGAGWRGALRGAAARAGSRLAHAWQSAGRGWRRRRRSGPSRAPGSRWRRAADAVSGSLPLRAGVVQSGDRMVALNRPPAEDAAETVSTATLDELFAGLDYRVLTGTLEDGRSLTNEVWRTFLIVMAAALLGEALLCLPPRRALAAPRPA